MRRKERGSSKIEYYALCLLFLSFLIYLSVATITIPKAQNLEGPIIIAKFDVPVDAGSSRFMQSAIQRAINEKASAIIIDMNTPGGLLSDMITILSSISDANQSGIPSYTYVEPNGLAASAGSYIAMACNKIYMGPGCEIGPSTPIVVGGTALEQNHTEGAMLKLLVGLAEKWGRNTTAAYQMVKIDLAYTTAEALKYHVIDGSASSLDEFISDIGLTGERISMSESAYDQFLSFLSNTTVDGLLMLIGILAIYIDVQHGTIILTAVGIAAIALGLAGAEIISASLLGFVLIAVAGFFIIIELKIGHGIAILTGTIVGAAGIYYLANGISYSPSPFGTSTYIGIGAFIAAGILLAIYFRRVIGPLRHRRSLTGPESFIDKVGEAISDLNPNGEIKVEGETWRARSKSGKISKGQKVKVVSYDSITLIVEPVET